MPLPAAKTKRIRCIAHRGFSSRYPENTRAAFDAAIDVGADAIELDIQLSADGIPFVFHDHNFERMGGASENNENTPFSTIKQRDIGSWFESEYASQRVLTLEDLFRLYIKRIHLLIEIKTWVDPLTNITYYISLLQHLVSLANRYHAWDTFELLCYSPEVLYQAYALDGRFRLVLNTDKVISAEDLQKLHANSIETISVYIKNLTKDFTANVRTAGFSLYAFTCDQVEDVEKAVRNNADAIMANNPVQLRANLKRLNVTT